MKILFSLIVATLLLTSCAIKKKTVDYYGQLATELEEKTVAYDKALESRLASDSLVVATNPAAYGGVVDSAFQRDDYLILDHYKSINDSVSLTGYYLMAQAHRYKAEEKPEGKARALYNIIKTGWTLQMFAEASGKEGYIARFVGPRTPEVLRHYGGQCVSELNCFLTTYKDQNVLWQGDSTVKEYTAWFAAMASAYDALPNGDESAALKKAIAKNVTKVMQSVLDNVKSNSYHYIGYEGQDVTKENIVTIQYILPWLQIASFVNPEDVTWATKYNEFANDKLISKMIANLDMLTKTTDYEQIHLALTNLYYLVKLEKGEELKKKYMHVFNDVYQDVKDSNNVYFNNLYMALNGNNSIAIIHPDMKLLSEFKDVNSQSTIAPSEKEIDLKSVYSAFLHRDDASATIQSSKAYSPAERQANFLWSASPYRICYYKGSKAWWKTNYLVQKLELNSDRYAGCLLEGSGDSRIIYSGVDYLLAYWIGKSNGFYQ
jgi:hypothetical protein